MAELRYRSERPVCNIVSDPGAWNPFQCSLFPGLSHEAFTQMRKLREIKKLQKQLEAEKEKNKTPEPGSTSLTASDTPSLPVTVTQPPD